jgi:hypothetical protein
MYGFLILLPLTLISLLIGSLIASSTQVADYVAYITDLSRQDGLPQAWADRRFWMQIGSHVAGYAVLCFTLIATVRTISAPLPSDRPAALRYFQLLLEVVFVAVPSMVLLWINGHALRSDWENRVHWLTVAVLCLGLVITVAVTAARRPLELYGSSARPFAVTIVDAFAALSVVAIGATIVAFAFYPVDSAHIIGMFPVLMLATAAGLLLLAAIFSRRASPVAIISSLITGVLFLHLVDQVAFPPREFRYKKLPLNAAAGGKPAELAVSEVKAQRKIPNLVTAFHQWLEHRRPAIEAYKSKGSAYPVFFVSAQGGGMYAAYHPALSLARLTDQCPEFAHHLFGISSVSGGSLGAAVFAELLRTLPAKAPNDPASPSASCSPTGGPEVDNLLQTKVQEFFNTDFLSPVIASAFIFDIPSLFVPQLRFGQDRARALEFGFETAWRKLGLTGRGADGLSSDFLERWEPTGLAPALFMSTTGVNFGIPVLVSQVDWSYNPASTPSAKAAEKMRGAEAAAPSAALVQSVLERLSRSDDQLQQVGVSNILDFRPDVQLPTSTAVVLSARFPFVTPPGVIMANAQIASKSGLYQKTKVLELTDGAFYDNSGGIVARDIIAALARHLDKDARFKDFKDSVRLHLIRFTDTPAKRQGGVSETGHFELVTPLVAYDAVRQSRGVLLSRPPQGTGISNIYLLDEWYEGTLNWLLTRNTKTNIEKRSSWLKGYENEVCCEVRDSVTSRWKRIPLAPDEKEKLDKSSLKIRPFVPNAGPFLRIIALIDRGAGPDGNPMREARVTAPEPPSTVPPPTAPPAIPSPIAPPPAAPETGSVPPATPPAPSPAR